MLTLKFLGLPAHSLDLRETIEKKIDFFFFDKLKNFGLQRARAPSLAVAG